ncbi:MAG: allophanate hydrolase subunit 1 [Nocardioidaceae bacterium]
MTSVVTTVRAYGDAGLLVEFDGGDRDQRWGAARDLGAALRSAPPPGVLDVVASFASVFVSFDPLAVESGALARAIESMPTADQGQTEPRLFTIPVAYGGDFGPDLEQVAEALGFPPARLVDLHTRRPWFVRLVGSPAGAPLTEGPRLPANVPRLATPRTRVEPGSVGLSGAQCIVYNAPSPGGWQLIGRTPLKLFDLTSPPHVGYRPGDRIRFTAIDHTRWDELYGRPLVGEGVG